MERKHIGNQWRCDMVQGGGEGGGSAIDSNGNLI